MKKIVLAAALVLLLGGLIALPLTQVQDNITNLVILVFLYVMLSSSWNILGGFTGQTNLGHAAFFGLGALATRLLWLEGKWPIIPSIMVGVGAAVALALLIGLPAFRLRGVYFAIGTLAMGQILNVTVGNVLPEISAIPPKDLATYALLPRYYVFLALAVVTVVAAYVLANSRLGLGMMAVREGEDAAESLGVSALQHKLLALIISASLAGLAGGAFAFYHVGYYPSFPFGPTWTFDSVMVAYLGGTGTVIGPVIGSIFYVVVKELLALRLADYHLIIFGALFVLVVLFMPGGLVEAWSKIRKVLTHGGAPTPPPQPAKREAGPLAKERSELSE